jgi:putative phosphoesterase
MNAIIGVVSDTHMPRFGRALPAALERGLVAARVELILHLGDFTEPEVVGWFERIAPIEAVAGNNDPPVLHARFGVRKIVTVAHARIGLIHGHGRRGTTEQRARSAFSDEEVDLICFGHSHVPLCRRSGHSWLLNPGSPSDKRRQPRFSYALVTIRDGRVTPSLCFYDDKRSAPV